MANPLLRTLLMSALSLFLTVEGGGMIFGGFGLGRNKPETGIPYVTDGLVTHFDGIWNAGIGVHDASAQKWTDLTNMLPDITDTTSFTWGDDCLTNGTSDFLVFASVVNNTTDMQSFYERTGIAQYESASDYSLQSDYTVEMVITFNIGTYSSLVNQYVFTFSMDTNRTGYNFSTPWSSPRLIFGPSVGWSPIGSGYKGFVIGDNKGFPISFQGRAVLSGVNDYKCNGTLVSSYDGSAPSVGSAIRGYHKMQIGLPAGCKMHRFSIYNRKLTEAEQEKNRNVDVKRFKVGSIS